MRLYYLFGQLLRPLMALGFYIYNHLTHRPRARVVVRNEYGEFLLVRNWGGLRSWGLSGGGVERGERPVEAARRELNEEVGIDVPIERFEYLTTLEAGYPAPIYVVTVVRGDLPALPHNPWEITHVAWFSADNLPLLSPLTKKILSFMADQV
jgi:8-oxo-dGTP pyrophosphatase MutT (NUDIX family)